MIDADERAQMHETVSAALEGATASRSGSADVDAALAELGWRDMLGEHPDDAIHIVFAALGKTNAASCALDDLLAHALGHEPSDDLCVLLPKFARWDAPGRIRDGDVRATGLASRRIAGAARVLLVCDEDTKPKLVVANRAAARATAIAGIDPASGFHVVEIEVPAAQARSLDTDRWQRAVDLARRALAHQLTAASRAMLDLARTHALERMQFGRPIARFQAVRHRLAEALVAVEAAEAGLSAAREAPCPETAALAKALAGRAAQSVGAHSQQVLAGVGFTTEHAFHRYLKRTLALEGLFGSASEIVVDTGRRLLSERRVPTLIEL